MDEKSRAQLLRIVFKSRPELLDLAAPKITPNIRRRSHYNLKKFERIERLVEKIHDDILLDDFETAVEKVGPLSFWSVKENKFSILFLSVTNNFCVNIFLLNLFFKKCPKTVFWLFFQKFARGAENLATIGAKQCFGRARKINLVDKKKGRQNFRIFFWKSPPPLEKILDPPLSNT